jgi:hypothetical protein
MSYFSPQTRMFPGLSSKYGHENRYVTRRSVRLSLFVHYFVLIYLFSRKIVEVLLVSHRDSLLSFHTDPLTQPSNK